MRSILLNLKWSGIAVLVALTALLAAPISAARAQDSFVRVTERETGQELLSVLGTGIGLAYASLGIELRCPVNEAWTMQVTGVRAAGGTPIEIGFGDVDGAWTPIRSAPLRFDDRSLSLGVDHAALHAALERARAGDRDAASRSEMRIMIGDALGISVSRDDLLREMAAFARDCDRRGAAPPMRAAAYSR